MALEHAQQTAMVVNDIVPVLCGVTVQLLPSSSCSGLSS